MKPQKNSKNGYINPQIIRLIAVVGTIGVAIYWYIQRPYVANIEVCNSTPYYVHYSLNYRLSKKSGETTEKLRSLDPGSCATVTKKFKDISPLYYVHAESIQNGTHIMWVHAPNIGKMDQIYWPTAEYKGAKFSCIGYCDGSSEKLPFAEAKKTAAHGRRSSWEFFIYDPSVSFLTESPDQCTGNCKKIALNRASDLSNAIDRQIQFATTWKNKALPYFISTKVTDPNGPFNVGVTLEGIIPQTMFGDDTSLREGDIVYSINGITVFSPQDLFIPLYQHATSHDAGIERPIKLGISRNENSYIINTVFYFNYYYWGSQPSDELKTIGYSVADTVSLGLAAQSICVSEAGAQVGRNIGSWLGEKIAKNGFDTNINLGHSKVIDVPLCIWETKQEIARLRQYDSKLFENSAWFAIVTPSLPRLLLSEEAARGLRVAGLTRGAARTLTTIALETSETILWTINSASPLTSTSESIRDVRRIAPYAVGAGLIAGTLERR